MRPSGFSVQTYVDPSGRLHDLRQPDVDRPSRQIGDAGDAGVGDVERDLGLLDEHLEPRIGVAGGPRRDADDVAEFAVREVRLVAAKVDVDAGRARDRAGHAVRVDELGGEHTDANACAP